LYGADVHEWDEEGIPIAAMGKDEQMALFRERRGTPVPWDIEQWNEDSYRDNVSVLDRIGRERAGETPAPTVVRRVVSSPGRPLPEDVRAEMETRMDESFTDVRIHTGSRAAAAADSIDARAFTVGNHVVFGHDEYDPDSVEGQYVLAHELAHVRQQTTGSVSMLPTEATAEMAQCCTGSYADPPEADSGWLLTGRELGVSSLWGVDTHVQRLPDDDGWQARVGANFEDGLPDSWEELDEDLRDSIETAGFTEAAKALLAATGGKGADTLTRMASVELDTGESLLEAFLGLEVGPADQFREVLTIAVAGNDFEFPVETHGEETELGLGLADVVTAIQTVRDHDSVYGLEQQVEHIAACLDKFSSGDRPAQIGAWSYVRGALHEISVAAERADDEGEYYIGYKPYQAEEGPSADEDLSDEDLRAVAADEMWIEELASDFTFLIEDEDGYRFPSESEDREIGGKLPDLRFGTFVRKTVRTKNKGPELDGFKISDGGEIYLEAKSGETSPEDVVRKVTLFRAYTAASRNVSGEGVIFVIGDTNKSTKINETVSKMENVSMEEFPR
jgi:hypothetical protein